MKVCFLLNSYTSHRAHNYLLFANAALELGHDSYLVIIDTLCVRNGTVWGRSISVMSPLVAGTEIRTSDFAWRDLSSFDVVWLVGFGDYASKDLKLQMLWLLSRRTRVVNPVETLQFLHNKFHLNLWSDLFQSPETHLSPEFEYLWNIFVQSEGDWIVKPPSGSFGRDVFRLKRGDSNAKVLLQHFTGNGAGHYCLMQRYVPEVRNGEKRVLIAADAIVCTYRKDIVLSEDHRTNVRQGGASSMCDLAPEEVELCSRIGRFFSGEEACYIGVDLCYPYVIELNVINPGGLINYERLAGENLAWRVVERILAS